MEVYTVYRTDRYLSYASRDLLGIYSTRRKSVKRIEGDTELDDYDRWNLENYNQTQCRNNNDENYMIECITVNENL